jgi:hypothetical protein
MEAQVSRTAVIGSTVKVQTEAGTWCRSLRSVEAVRTSEQESGAVLSGGVVGPLRALTSAAKEVPSSAGSLSMEVLSSPILTNGGIRCLLAVSC